MLKKFYPKWAIFLKDTEVEFNITCSKGTASSEALFILLKPIQVSAPTLIEVENAPNITWLNVNLNEYGALFLEKTPLGGKLIAYSFEEKYHIIVDTAPATIELKFTASEKIASGKLHIRINLINSSGNVVCTTPATILEGKYFKAVLLAPKKGDYMIQVNLQYLSQDKVSLTMTLSKVEKTSLSSFNYNKEWNVWVGILKSIKQ